MKAKELYKELESALKPLMTSHGFRKARASRLQFQRVAGGKYQTIWFQCDKWGWDPLSGGKFFANFTVSGSPDVEAADRREERLPYFLTPGELVAAREYQDKIVERIPKPPESYFENLYAEFSKHAESAADLVETVRSQFEPEPLAFSRNWGFSMRYWEPVDVRGWATLIESVVPRAIEEMQVWSLPEYRDG